MPLKRMFDHPLILQGVHSSSIHLNFHRKIKKKTAKMRTSILKNILDGVCAFFQLWEEQKLNILSVSSFLFTRARHFAWCSPILSWSRITFSKRIYYDFFNRRLKRRKRECFESSGWQTECFECFKSSGWCLPSFRCAQGSAIRNGRMAQFVELCCSLIKCNL